jgi:hypothetical protein
MYYLNSEDNSLDLAKSVNAEKRVIDMLNEAQQKSFQADSNDESPFFLKHSKNYFIKGLL